MTTKTRTERRRRRGRLAITLAGVAVLVAGGALAITVGTRDDTAAPGAGGAPAESGTVASTSTTASAAAGATGQPPRARFGYQPLWPFANPAEVEEWRRAYHDGGHAPWHLDAEATALAFTTGYLDFTGVDVVVWRSIEGTEAQVAVGYPVQGAKPAVAAVLHLVKYGSGTDAPWEVVGSRDTSLTLTEPGYGSQVHSPMRVGGKLTGVDESIKVQVRQPHAEKPVGTWCCRSAGGEDRPWSATVSFRSPGAGALTVVASTGGHYTDVERFAITGVRHTR